MRREECVSDLDAVLSFDSVFQGKSTHIVPLFCRKSIFSWFFFHNKCTVNLILKVQFHNLILQL